MKALTRSDLHPAMYLEEEQKLWREMLAGDVTAYEHLIDRTYDLLFHYGTKFNGDRELIKDCIQDVFLGVWEKRNALNPEIPPKPYLLASLRRRLHRLASRLRMDCMDYYNESDIVFDLEFNAEYQLIESENDRILASRMTEMLNELPKRQKEAVFLRFYNDMEREEIAMVMDIQPQSVSNLLQEAFKFIKSHWKAIVSLVLALPF
ncbi:RNA polymerase sigma factor, sigma-70 family [Dyadobacter soli]|uniref:RNA polymerase sigma factor, sigma-70 family n=1 Tax=Dyadobacter soli TaxID=659014 RepID=A0A1G7VXL9_9BACT|nr:sigma-70 family RNA polymerase sigma factor [Dyadobacter soli]SDG64179.1 RNA polymerase sigma factor, sigma-70 family [Dyadobacter soli]